MNALKADRLLTGNLLEPHSKNAFNYYGGYLSFGFLKWAESENTDQTFISPLVLVPVALTVESIKSPYVLNLHEDEIILNPTLVDKLENDFGITLPAFDDADDIDDFLNEVRSKTSLKNWSVVKEVGLSLLLFLKINMYSDLNKHKDTIVENPIVCAISGDATVINKVSEKMAALDVVHRCLAGAGLDDFVLFFTATRPTIMKRRLLKYAEKSITA